MKNQYMVEKEEIIFRRANIDDNIDDIAELIYKTDPYIYPFWFENNLDNAKEYLSAYIKAKGSLFNIDNIYVAYDKTLDKIIGIICAIDKSVNLDYDYTQDEAINNNYKFTIENYIKELVKEIKEYETDDILYISNVCVNENYRGKRIGSHLIGYYVSQMEKSGFNTFSLDCLLHNLRAKNLYHSMGFKEMKEIVGFDGTETSSVEVVSFLRKKGDYLPEEFQISFLDDVK